MGWDGFPGRWPTAIALFASAAFAAGLGGCAVGPGGAPGEPVAPPPMAAWRPGEALALLLKPPKTGVLPIDDDYLARTRPYRVRMQEAEDLSDQFQRIDKTDRGGHRAWFLDGPQAVFVRIDIGNDGTVDQTQYYGPEGLFAIVHRFAGGRRTQRIYWPPGEPRIVEVRDNLPPYPGVWWRTQENPFDEGRRTVSGPVEDREITRGETALGP